MNEYIKDELDEINAEQENKNYEIKDLSGANWAFRKLSALTREKSEIEALAENEANRIEEWKMGKTRTIDNEIAYFESIIKDYYIKERNNNPKFKLSTPYGKVASKLNTDWQYDEATLFEELKGSELIKTRTTESIDKVTLKRIATVLEDGKVVMPDGVILEGVTATKRLNVSVKPADDLFIR